MKTAPFEVGQEVIRIKGDYVVGRTGTVLALDLEKNRAQVQWVGCPKTWVSFNAIGLTSEWEVVEWSARRKKTN